MYLYILQFRFDRFEVQIVNAWTTQKWVRFNEASDLAIASNAAGLEAECFVADFPQKWDIRHFFAVKDRIFCPNIPEVRKTRQHSA